MDNRLILVRYGEIILKGGNRRFFEDKLMENIRNVLRPLGSVSVVKSQARIYVEPRDDFFDVDEGAERLKRVFGIVSVSIAERTSSSLDTIKEKSLQMVKNLLLQKPYKTFKAEAKRGDKEFPLPSPEICADVGGYIMENLSDILTVDVHNPDFIIYIEVRNETFIYTEKLSAQGGMPYGSNGRAMLLLSGGIDSPVAGYMMAKRGLEIDCIHYYSYPYTSERAKDKVIELVRIMSEYCYRIRLHIIPFTDIQLAVRDNCPEDESVIIMRRLMMRMAEKLAVDTDCKALVTGEALGQVASQTIMSINCTNAAVEMPVFRPLIGMDKEEVVAIARKIGTFETSILPYEDCCTVFVPKHPKTKPALHRIIKSEQKMDTSMAETKALSEAEVIEMINGRIVDSI